jgi:actin-like ATPase involved in cell morphogenesis
VTYQLGIDLGTTYTAAAVHRDGRSSIFSLGSQAASVPSVVLLREDGTELTGESAARRALTEPERVAREFKRRLGDTTPIIVGGAPYSAEQLMARLLKATLAEVEQREGEPPSHVAITHPANWGPYKTDLLQQAIRLAGIDRDSVVLLTEPEAAAISYASQERVEPGKIIAVYDLGGGTFDAAVLRKTETGFDIIGRPEGIERMGGIDFDAAVFAHVNRALDGQLAELDPEDPMVMNGVARLREDCVDAKIALSSDTDATIPVLLPGLQTEVRITRSEFETLIRPSLSDSIASMHRALESAGITAAEVDKVLLVGGSSRIPLISQLVSSELGRPVAVDADPKHSIPLGAATFAGAAAATRVAPIVPPGAAPLAAAAAVPPIVEAFEPVVPPTEQMPTTAAPVAATQPLPLAPSAPEAPVTAPSGGSGSKTPIIIAAAAVALLAIGGFVVFGMGRGDSTEVAVPEVPVTASVAPEPEAEPVVSDPAPETAVETIPAPTTIETIPAPTDEALQAAVLTQVTAVSPVVGATVTQAVATLTGVVTQQLADAAFAAASSVEGLQGVNSSITIVQDDEFCSDVIQSAANWACITSATFDGETVRAEFTDGGTEWNNGATHLHFFADSVPAITAGGNGSGVSEGGGLWIVWDVAPMFEASVRDLGGSIERLCVRIALFDHSLESLDSGNCWAVEQISG